MGWGRTFLLLLGLASLLASTFLWLIWHAYYWVHRDCIEEAWRTGGNGCFAASESVNYSGNASVLIWPATILLVLALLCFWRVAIRRKAS
jgi:hypothetical protein